MALSVPDVIRALRLPANQDYWQEGGAGYSDCGRVLEQINDTLTRLAPDSAASGADDLAALGRARDEAAMRLLGYRIQRLGSLWAGPFVGVESDALEGVGPNELLYSGALQVISPWRRLRAGFPDSELDA
ncbi:MAG: hypothetical protein OXI18_11545 [bacterium]|nr:hypothetical protein [bacterium]